MNPITCPQCGAQLPNPPGLQCAYCGMELQAKVVGAPPAGPANQKPALLLPALASLKRPKPVNSFLQSLFLMLFAIPWTLCVSVGIVVMAGTFINEYATYNRLRSEAVTVTGTITRLNKDESDDSTNYDVYYRFKAPINGDLTSFDALDSVSQGVFNTLEKGGSLDVIYVRSDPQISAVKADWKAPDKLPIVFVAIIEIFGLGMAAFLFIPGARALKRFLDLRAKGELTQAIVFDRWEEKGSENSSYFVAYAYRVPGFGEQLFTASQQSQLTYRKLNIGDQVSLRYLPDNPKICNLVDYWW